MPWVEFKVGTDRLSHHIRTEAIVKVFELKGEYGLVVGVCVQGQDMPTWIKLPLREVLFKIKQAERRETIEPPSAVEHPPIVNTAPDDDIPF